MKKHKKKKKKKTKKKKNDNDNDYYSNNIIQKSDKTLKEKVEYA